MLDAPKILIVDDEHLVAMDMEIQLAACGFETIGIAATGKQALRLAEELQPDLIVMDVQLLGSLDGVATAAQIQQLKKTPIVFVTAVGHNDIRQRAEEAGCCGFLIKPFRPEDLKAVVSSTLNAFATG